MILLWPILIRAIRWRACRRFHFMSQLPRKLKKDAIVEAICEVRFECTEVAELVIGRLADVKLWRDFAKTRLAGADIPAPIRDREPAFRYQPIVELRNPQASRIVKVGSKVISYHVLKPYCGWDKFQPEIENMYEMVFNLFDGFNATRLGFRYINALTKNDHMIGNIIDLTSSVNIADVELHAPLNLNYRVKYGDQHEVAVRIASPEYVAGSVQDDMTVLIDVDVYTLKDFSATDNNIANAWTRKAHEYEKTEFFKLIPKTILAQLVEE